ncbi:MAG: DUF86 domain-containing protein [Candidatus Taylorbacteria bacterium]|nr:DUF86 domain-containing protein [Candidatus Taylorbacteria bacterium]
MSKELILKKLEQLKGLLGELEKLLKTPLEQFAEDLKTIRAAERNFELIVETASDVNTQLLLDLGKRTPDTYKESFMALKKEKILSDELASRLVTTAKLRKILIHEYDFEEDYKLFYQGAKKALPAYSDYISSVMSNLDLGK